MLPAYKSVSGGRSVATNAVGACVKSKLSLTEVNNPPTTTAEWGCADSLDAKHASWPTKVLDDASYGNLPAVSWVIHPSTGSDRGPSWVAAVVNAIGEGRLGLDGDFREMPVQLGPNAVGNM